MNYTLENSNLKATVSNEGAYLLGLTFQGKDIIFPKKTFTIGGTEKVRGGSHVCLPQFSDGSRKNLPSHGFGRDLTWDVKETSEETLVLELSITDGDYAGLLSEITYLVKENRFTTKLSVKNTSNNVLEIAPAFHPYFSIGDALESGASLQINGTAVDPKDAKFGATDFQTGITSFETPEFHIDYENENLNVFALWTDLQDAYFCVEPTYHSTAFRDGSGWMNLQPEETAVFSYTLNITLK